MRKQVYIDSHWFVSGNAGFSESCVLYVEMAWETLTFRNFQSKSLCLFVTVMGTDSFLTTTTQESEVGNLGEYRLLHKLYAGILKWKKRKAIKGVIRN